MFLGLLFYGGPGDAGWLHHLRKSAVFALIFFVWGLLPESDDDDWPGKAEPELSEAPFVAAPKTRARVGLVSLALLFSGMLLWSIAVVLGFSEGGTVAFHLVFGALSLWFIAACLNDRVLRVAVSETALEIRRLTSVARIPLPAIVSFERLSPWWMLPSFSSASVYQLRWTDSEGRARRILLGLNPNDLRHGHGLKAVLMSASTLKSNQCND